MAALCSSLCATAQAFSGVRISGASTCEWLMDFWCSSSPISKSSPRSQCQSRSPHTDPQISPACSRSSASRSIHGVKAFFVQPLLRARADARQVAQRELMQRFGQNVERQRHQAIGLFHVAGNFGEIAIGGEAHGAAQHRPTRSRIAALTRMPRSMAASSGRSRPISRQAISSMEQTAVTGTQLSTASTTRWWYSV